MLRQVLTFVFCLVVASADTKIQKMIQNGIASLGAQCLSENQDASMTDVEELVNHAGPQTRRAMCLITCIHKKVGMQDKQGKLSEEGVLSFLETLKQEDIDYYELIKSHFVNCVHTVSDDDDDDECVIGARFNDCVIIGAKEKRLFD